MKDLFYLDEHKKPQRTNWDEVMESVRRIQEFFRAVKRRFVDRDEVIDMIMWAMMMREHIMITGPTGAAKSGLITCIFEGIQDAQIWAMDLTKTTSEAHLFGSFDMREMRDSGRLIHMTEGTLGEAHFVQTGEFLDANDHTLRALLGALNERRVRKGAQEIRPPLLSAVADTNFSPEQFSAQRRALLKAVVDRFLFRTAVRYVEGREKRLAMLDMSLDGVHETELPEISLIDFVRVSGLIRGMNLIEDTYVRQAYEEITRRYNDELKKAGKDQVSDRRFIRGAQILEVSALLDGRRFVTFEDLPFTKHVLVHDGGEAEKFFELIASVTEDWKQRSDKREVEEEKTRLKQIFDKVGDETDLSPMQTAELGRLATQVGEVIEELGAFRAISVEAGRQQMDFIRRLVAKRAQIADQIVTIVIDNLPEIPDKPDDAELFPLMRQVKSASEALADAHHLSDDLMLRQQAAFDRVLAARAKLEIAFQEAGVSMKSAGR